MLNLMPLLRRIPSSLDVGIIITIIIIMDMVTMARGLLMPRLHLLLMLIHSSLGVAIIITMAIGIIMAMAMDTMDNEKRQTEQFMYSNTKSSVIYFSHEVGFVINLVMTG